ncbi:MAG TPA: hypothetical protein H9903_09480 [Candidatus Aquabacterium excrementipullorum]|nr:hypothetical protein [Candidatus Aquabacterium excrementipullorum]
MAHSSSSFELSTLPQDTAGSERPVTLEKAGVVVGFLAGLGVGVGAVYDAVSASALPNWSASVAAVAVVALFTWAGLRAASRIGRLLDR